jgi:putative transposase
LAKIEYKLTREGGRIAKIDRWLPLSKRCSCCGAITKELKLSGRDWQGVACGKIHGRDDNVRQNIRTEAIVILNAAGRFVSAYGGRVSPAVIARAAANEVGSLLFTA